METLVINPKDKPKETVDWGTNTVSFENGKKQYQQIWTEPEISISLTTEGSYEYIQGIIDFYNKRKGIFEPFYCDPYKNGNKEIYRFANKLSVTWNYGEGEKLGGSIDIDLIKEKGQKS